METTDKANVVIMSMAIVVLVLCIAALVSLSA